MSKSDELKEKQMQYTIKYAKKTLKRISLDVKKEYYENVLLPEAQKRNMTMRRFILTSIEEKISREKE